MTGSTEKPGSLAELAALLDTWGGDTTRWPREAAVRLARLETLPGAAALIGEARAFDRLLDTASEVPALLPGGQAQALTDRIMAAALTEVPGAKVSSAPRGEVISFPVRPILPRRAEIRTSSGRSWRAAGLIAASLMLGVVIGGNLNVGPVVQELAEVAGLASLSDPSLGDDLGEEDAL